jgi:CO/xanthine dehydrogenase FAD-binding subunit
VVASDLAPVLVALDATVVTTTREIPAGAFFAAVEGGSTVLEPTELVLEVVLPPDAAARRCAFRKFRLRNAIDFPIVSAAVSFRVEHGSIEDPRVVLGAAAPVPLRAAAVEAALVGHALEDVGSRAFGRHLTERVLEGSVTLPDSAYKAQIAAALVVRAVRRAAGLPEQSREDSARGQEL